MDIAKTAVEWTRAEVFSSMFFILFGVVFIVGSFGFRHVGKTELAQAYVIPTLVAGVLLLAIGLGIFAQSQYRVTAFPAAHEADAAGFIASEVARADRVLRDYGVTVFRAIPVIIAVAALLFVFLEGPVWRASLVTVIAMMAVILLVDTNASARLKAYQGELEQVTPTG